MRTKLAVPYPNELEETGLCSFSMPEDLLKEMDQRATSFRMSRTEYLKALVRIDLHARPEFLAVPADGVGRTEKDPDEGG